MKVVRLKKAIKFVNEGKKIYAIRVLTPDSLIRAIEMSWMLWRKAKMVGYIVFEEGSDKE